MSKLFPDKSIPHMSPYMCIMDKSIPIWILKFVPLNDNLVFESIWLRLMSCFVILRRYQYVYVCYPVQAIPKQVYSLLGP